MAKKACPSITVRHVTQKDKERHPSANWKVVKKSKKRGAEPRVIKGGWKSKKTGKNGATRKAEAERKKCSRKKKK